MRSPGGGNLVVSLLHHVAGDRVGRAATPVVARVADHGREVVGLFGPSGAQRLLVVIGELPELLGAALVGRWATIQFQDQFARLLAGVVNADRWPWPDGLAHRSLPG